MGKTMEEYLEQLADCGIDLHPGRSKKDLLAKYSREVLERDVSKLIATLGEGISPQVWHFDTECIDGDGSYAAIARHLASMAGGDLPIEGIADHVDIDAGDAWLEFSLDDTKYHWKAVVQDDWLDPAIIDRFAGLLEKRNADKRFAQLDYGGQDVVLAVIPVSKFETVNRLPGVQFVWVTSANS